MVCEIPVALAAESNGMLSDRGFSCVVNRIRTKSGVAGILSCYTDQAINKLAARDIDTLAVGQFQKGGEVGLTLLGFIMNGTPGKGDVS